MVFFCSVGVVTDPEWASLEVPLTQDLTSITQLSPVNTVIAPWDFCGNAADRAARRGEDPLEALKEDVANGDCELDLEIGSCIDLRTCDFFFFFTLNLQHQSYVMLL